LHLGRIRGAEDVLGAGERRVSRVAAERARTSWLAVVWRCSKLPATQHVVVVQLDEPRVDPVAREADRRRVGGQR
jgi:hypothetical protein